MSVSNLDYDFSRFEYSFDRSNDAITIKQSQRRVENPDLPLKTVEKFFKCAAAVVEFNEGSEHNDELFQFTTALAQHTVRRVSHYHEDHVYKVLSSLPQGAFLAKIEQAFMRVIFASSGSCHLAILGPLLSRLSFNEIINSDVYRGARDRFTSRFMDYITSNDITDKFYFKKLLEIELKISPDCLWFTDIVVEELSTYNVQILIECLDELLQENPTLFVPRNELLKSIIAEFHKLKSCFQDRGATFSTFDLLRISHFSQGGSSNNETRLSQVAYAIATLPFTHSKSTELISQFFRISQAFVGVKFPASLENIASFTSPFLSHCNQAKNKLEELFCKFCYTHLKRDLFDALEADRDNETLGKLTQSELSDDAISLLSQIVRWIQETEAVPNLQRNRVFQRLDQLNRFKWRTGSFEIEPLLPSERFQLAYLIEKLSEQVADGAYRVFSSSETPMGRAITIDRMRNVVGIAAHPEKRVLLGSGASKDVEDYLECSLTDYTQDIVLKACALFRNRGSADALEKLQAEMEKMHLFDNAEHVLQLDASYEHEAEENALVLSRRMILQKFQYIGHELAVRETPSSPLKTISFAEILNLFMDFFKGTQALHKKGYIHADLSVENLLFTKLHALRKRVYGVVSDLGKAHAVNISEEARRKQFPYYYGLLGHAMYTPPELFGVIDFQGDHYKVEVFALGVCLYCMHYKKAFPTTQIADLLAAEIDREREQYRDLQKLRKLQDDFSKIIEEQIAADPHLRELFEKEEDELTSEELLELLIYSMLQSDPEKRISLDQAIRLLHEIILQAKPRPLKEMDPEELGEMVKAARFKNPKISQEMLKALYPDEGSAR